MNSYQETFETWNKIASLYQEKFMDLEIYDESYDFVCESINTPHARLLEIGCGPGNITKYLLSKRPDFKINGIDIAPNMIALAKQNNPTAHFKVLDSREIETIKEKFEGIISGFCIPYLSELDCSKFISDSKNLLVENGILYISFVEGEPNQSGFLAGSSGDRTYFYYHRLESIEKMLAENSFETIRVFKINYTKGDGNLEVHTILIAKRK